LVWEEELFSNSERIDLRQAKKGFYLVELTFNDGQKEVSKICLR